MVRINVGQKIKRARLAKGMTQQELGDLIGVQKSAVAKWENGRVVNIKRSTLAKISKILSIPPVELVNDIEDKPIETANRLADWYLTLEHKEEEAADIMMMLEEYNTLDNTKKAQVREYVHLLAGKN